MSFKKFLLLLSMVIVSCQRTNTGIIDFARKHKTLTSWAAAILTTRYCTYPFNPKMEQDICERAIENFSTTPEFNEILNGKYPSYIPKAALILGQAALRSRAMLTFFGLKLASGFLAYKITKKLLEDPKKQDKK